MSAVSARSRSSIASEVELKLPVRVPILSGVVLLTAAALGSCVGTPLSRPPLDRSDIATGAFSRANGVVLFPTGRSVRGLLGVDDEVPGDFGGRRDVEGPFFLSTLELEA